MDNKNDGETIGKRNGGNENDRGWGGLKDSVFHREGGGGERGQHSTPKFVMLFL